MLLVIILERDNEVIRVESSDGEFVEEIAGVVLVLLLTSAVLERMMLMPVPLSVTSGIVIGLMLVLLTYQQTVWWY